MCYFQPTDVKQQKISNFFTSKPPKDCIEKNEGQEIQILKKALPENSLEPEEIFQNSRQNKNNGRHSKSDKEEDLASNSKLPSNPIKKLCLKCLQASPKTEAPFCNNCNKSPTNLRESLNINITKEKILSPDLVENGLKPSKSSKDNKLSESPDLILPTPPLQKKNKNDKQSKSVKRKFDFTENSKASKKVTLSKENVLAAKLKETNSDTIPIKANIVCKPLERKEHVLKPLKRNPFSKSLPRTSTEKTSHSSEYMLKNNHETDSTSKIPSLFGDIENIDHQIETPKISKEHSNSMNKNEVVNTIVSNIESTVSDRTNLKNNHEDEKTDNELIDSVQTSTSKPISKSKTDNHESLSEDVCVQKDKVETESTMLNKCDDFNENLLDDLNFFETSQTE